MVNARQDCPTRNNRRTSLAAALALLARDASAANVCDPPRNLSANPVIGQATLNWDAPTSGTPTGYRIQQRVSWGEWTNLVDDTTTGREYVDTSIEHNTSHPYRIRVIYSNGTSGPSNAVKSRSPKNDAPPKPHSMRLNKLSNNNVSTRWRVSRKNGYNGIEKIEIKRRVSGDDPPGQYTTLATITTKANVRPTELDSIRPVVVRGPATVRGLQNRVKWATDVAIARFLLWGLSSGRCGFPAWTAGRSKT